MSNEPRLSQAPSCPGGTLYTIRAGDTLSALAGRFNTTVEAIIAANPGIQPRNLQIGQVICIPRAGAPGVCPNGTPYVIQAGDTFYLIAQRFRIPLPILLAANPQADPNRLQIGQVICVPIAPGPSPLCCVTLRLIAELPPSQLFPGGVALFKPAATATDAQSVTFAAASLPPPSILGDFDAYVGQVVIPATLPTEPPEVFGVVLQAVQTDTRITWAGTTVIPREVPSMAVVEVRVINLAVGGGGIAILRNTGEICA